jgi:aspartyl aminopeptidase
MAKKKILKKWSWERKSGWLRISKTEKKKIFDFSEDYKDFLSNNKTEREFVENALAHVKSKGFKDISRLKSIKKGDKLFYSYKNKALILAKVGSSPDFKLVAAHVDSPRLDLKPFPLTEDSDLAFFKSHYYGGIKKYHWMSRPLALHGVLLTKKNKVIKVSVGEKEGEPAFIISDLLPHLAYKQMDKKMSEVIQGETLQILIGNIPLSEDDKHSVKANVLKLLNEKYGIDEEDLAVGELEFVPADKPRDVGIDGSMIGGYGQDDRICAYTSLKALLDSKVGRRTNLALFVDKEEIGSVGNTSANSSFLLNFANMFARLYKAKETGFDLLFNSKGISADVTGAINPLFKDVHDSENASFLSRGVSVEKYGGNGGKYLTNDSSSEYFNEIRNVLNSAKVIWQTGELGKIDEGGGGTIAYILAKFGMDIIDVGPPMLGMHSPCEVVSKLDLFQTYKAYRAFYNEN